MCVCVCVCVFGSLYVCVLVTMNIAYSSSDERYMKKMKQMIDDLSSITREPRRDWNETLPDTPGYECYVNRTYNKPVRGPLQWHIRMPFIYFYFLFFV